MRADAATEMTHRSWLACLQACARSGRVRERAGCGEGLVEVLLLLLRALREEGAACAI